MKLEEIEQTINEESLKYIKEAITTSDLNTQVIAGLAFGTKYVVNNCGEVMSETLQFIKLGKLVNNEITFD